MLVLIGMNFGLSTLCHSFVFDYQETKNIAKNVSWSWLSLLRGWDSLTMAFTVNLYTYN